MRPIRLTIQAFGPYPGRHVIDFRDAVASGLFGIYGQTGSGKSTIFSAMTFALFGEAARDEQEAPSLRSDHADAGLQTEVELVFELGGRRFVVLRRPEQWRPKQRGEGETRIAHEGFLFDATGIALEKIVGGYRGKPIAEKKVSDVDAAISGMLGYGPKQFRQIVLLPQGRFETFLAAKTADRLKILRDLFDVSLYRDLATKLKDDADAAERSIRTERDVCAGRLKAEGFESTDALKDAIAEVDVELIALTESETTARETLDAAQMALQGAQKVEAQFVAAEQAQAALTTLQTAKSGFDALADQVERAGKARLLLDIEGQVADVASEVDSAQEKLKLAQAALEQAGRDEATAARSLEIEVARSGEVEDLRRRLEDLSRHNAALEKAAGATQSFETAQRTEQAATEKLAGAEKQLAGLQEKHAQKSESLKLLRENEDRRSKIVIEMAGLREALAAATGFEEAQNQLGDAREKLRSYKEDHEKAVRAVDTARSGLDSAERSLSLVQALHLASKLAPGHPCPVCGSLDHPAPATGDIEHAGLDRAFREAKEAWESADKRAREAANLLAGAMSLLQEREDRLASLAVPERSAASIKESVKLSEAALAKLGPEADLARERVAIDALGENIRVCESERDRFRNALAEWRSETAAKKAQLDEMLSPVPMELRSREAIAAAKEVIGQSLAELQEARAKAETGLVETREAAVRALNQLEGAEAALREWSQRRDGVVERFQSRLQEIGLAEEEFRALKPHIATIDDDSARVQAYFRDLALAESNQKAALDSVRGEDRPDLQAFRERLNETSTALADATEKRAGAQHRRDSLSKLSKDLAETFRKLERAEEESGPLRQLAALFTGNNTVSLDLETFAIGAMFEQVLKAANQRLGPMTSNRYSLDRDIESGRGRRGLGIRVFDVHTGKHRPTTTLSGGETFIAALALALGLADVVESTSGKVRLDTVFIDEGFGSLDTENGSGTLEQVLQVLSALVSQSRAIGLISHVPLVQDAIPNGFYVRKGTTGSSIEIRGLT